MDEELVELKQACLDLSNAAIKLFDQFDEHGFEAAWEGDGVLTVVELQRAHETLRQFFSAQSLSRLIAMGVSPESLAKIANLYD